MASLKEPEVPEQVVVQIKEIAEKPCAQSVRSIWNF